MKNFKLGLQMYSVREAFAEDPVSTLRRVKEMGFDGVEITTGAIMSEANRERGMDAKFFKKTLREIGLECYGLLTSWSNMQPQNLEATLRCNEEMESGFLVIGSVPTSQVSTIDEVNAAIEKMNSINESMRAKGVITGYHNHDSDHTHVVDGKPFFEYVFDNTPDDFAMLIDTGNARAGGCDSAAMFKKYPGRSPYLHVKGHSDAKGYLAYIGQDDFNWPELLRNAVDIGGSKVFDIEFGMRSDYDPFERAENGFKYVSALLEEIEAGK